MGGEGPKESGSRLRGRYEAHASPVGLPSRAGSRQSKTKGGHVINTRSCSRASSRTEHRRTEEPPKQVMGMFPELDPAFHCI